MTARPARAARWLKPALILAFGLAASLASAQPANDDFASAVGVTGNYGTTSGDNTLATLQPPCETNQVNCQDDGLRYVTNSVWFKWAAPVSGTVRFDTMGSAIDTILSPWTTAGNLCSASLTNLVSDDDSGWPLDPNGINTSLLQFEVTAGTTYYLSVNSYDDGSFVGIGDRKSVV